MTRPLSIDYIMEDPREAIRLEQKLAPEAWIEKYLEQYLYPHADVLSVGCGPGTVLRAITASHPTVRATGIDISVARIRQAKERNQGNRLVQFICGDARAMQFASGRFDVVYTRMLLQYLVGKEEAVAEMVRVCKPGGVVVMQDLDGQLVWHYPKDPAVENTIEKVVTALGETGFDPFVGRKLFWLARKAGLHNVHVRVECYHLIAGEADPTSLNQWKLKLEIARPHVVRALGSEREAAQEIERFLEYLSNPDTLTYSNVFTITGEKPL